MKSTLALVALAALSVSMFAFGPSAHATVPSTNTASYLNYAQGPDADRSHNIGASNSNGQWWATEGQPTKTFHRLSVRDSSGCVIAIGHGTSPTQVVDLYVGGSGAASTHEVVYPFGLSYGGASTSIWWKRISCEPVSGEQMINFIY